MNFFAPIVYIGGVVFSIAVFTMSLIGCGYASKNTGCDQTTSILVYGLFIQTMLIALFSYFKSSNIKVPNSKKEVAQVIILILLVGTIFGTFLEIDSAVSKPVPTATSTMDVYLRK